MSFNFMAHRGLNFCTSCFWDIGFAFAFDRDVNNLSMPVNTNPVICLESAFLYHVNSPYCLCRRTKMIFMWNIVQHCRLLCRKACAWYGFVSIYVAVYSTLSPSVDVLELLNGPCLVHSPKLSSPVFKIVSVNYNSLRWEWHTVTH